MYCPGGRSICDGSAQGPTSGALVGKKPSTRRLPTGGVAALAKEYPNSVQVAAMLHNPEAQAGQSKQE
jgi:hypothetical protein